MQVIETKSGLIIPVQPTKREPPKRRMSLTEVRDPEIRAKLRTIFSDMWKAMGLNCGMSLGYTFDLSADLSRDQKNMHEQMIFEFAKKLLGPDVPGFEQTT